MNIDTSNLIPRDTPGEYCVLVTVQAETGDEAWDTVSAAVKGIEGVKVKGAPRCSRATLSIHDDGVNLITFVEGAM